MPTLLKVSCLVIANMILFMNISNFLKWKVIYIMTFKVTHLDTWDDSLYAREQDYWEH